MAYLAILTMGGFGLVIAVVSHFAIERERRAIIAARARLAEEGTGVKPAEAKAAPGKASAASSVLSRGASGAAVRPTRTAPKQYRRVQAK